jgi:hypothetical protein
VLFHAPDPPFGTTYSADGTGDPALFARLWEKHRAAWDQFVDLGDLGGAAAERIKIPYEGPIARQRAEGTQPTATRLAPHQGPPRLPVAAGHRRPLAPAAPYRTAAAQLTP